MTGKTDNRDRKARQFICPVCKAQPGFKCTTVDSELGLPAGTHTARRKVWQQWRDANNPGWRDTREQP